MIIWNIKLVAREKGLTMKSLAEAAEISYSELYKIERGEVDPRFSHVWALAKALKVEVKELFSENV